MAYLNCSIPEESDVAGQVKSGMPDSDSGVSRCFLLSSELSLRKSSSSQPGEGLGATLTAFVKVRCGCML